MTSVLIKGTEPLYIARRNREYPTIQEQLDKIWHAMEEGSLPKNNSFYQSILEVKNRHPKPPSASLQELKIEKWAEIKRMRDLREFSTFVWDGSTFDADDISQRRIQGAAMLAMIAQSAGQPFSIDWTLADNSIRSLTDAQMLAVGEALGVHVETQHAIARTLRAAINAATTKAEVDAVVWPT